MAKVADPLEGIDNADSVAYAALFDALHDTLRRRDSLRAREVVDGVRQHHLVRLADKMDARVEVLTKLRDHYAALK